MTRGSNVRERLLRAALELFSRKPYSRVSVGEVAGRAGVSKGALFHYFKSKLDLAEGALMLFLEGLVSGPLRRILESEEPFRVKVGRIVELVLSISLKSSMKALLFLSTVYEELRRHGRGQAVVGIYDVWMREFARFFRENGVRHPEVKARVFMAVLDGLAFQCMLMPDEFRDERVRGAIIREVVSMLRC